MTLRPGPVLEIAADSPPVSPDVVPSSRPPTAGTVRPATAAATAATTIVRRIRIELSLIATHPFHH
jgi:hypothetical protein